MSEMQRYPGLPQTHMQNDSMGAAKRSIGATPDEPERDVHIHLKNVDSMIHRLGMIESSLGAQISRLYGEGEPAPASPQGRPQPVGLHHELAIRLEVLGAVVQNIEDKVGRLARFA